MCRSSTDRIVDLFLGSETHGTFSFFFHFVWNLISFNGHSLQRENLTNTNHSGVCVVAVIFVQDVPIYPVK